jgi:hypothetical protein
MATMKPDPVESIADAVLHEGFMLYPYRPSAMKNRQRWNFGVLFPPRFCARAENGDRAELWIECLADCAADARVAVKVRFMQLGGDGEPVERTVAPAAIAIGDLRASSHRHEFSFGLLRGAMEFSARAIDERTTKLAVVIANTSEFHGETRDEALAHALLSCHALLSIEQGAFLSMVDAPPELLALADCQNVGVWPVLVGAEGARDRMLASPIILCDYPRIAPESPTAMFDGTEIDEILSLRIQTLTPDEKAELRRHPRTAALLDRVDSLAQDEMASLHGTWNRPNSPKLQLKPGDAVILRPKRRADIFDLALAGRRATVSSIECDFEDRVHVCVTVDDDPGRDLGREGKPGHRFFFDLDEVELP